MLEHEIKKKVLTIGNRKGQTVYYACLPLVTVRDRPYITPIPSRNRS